MACTNSSAGSTSPWNAVHRPVRLPTGVAGDISRRQFISASAAVGVATATGASFAGHSRAAGSDTIRIGLVGCGGRGTGAVINALNAADGVELVAMGDLFPDQMARSVETIRKEAEELNKPGAFKADEGRRFIGWDAYEKVLAVDEVNYVILATPCVFRPMHAEAAVAAGKHLFVEKPVAVDPTGVRQMLAVGEEASRRGLSILAGTQARYSSIYQEYIDRIRQGEFGDVCSANTHWDKTGVWSKPRRPEWDDTTHMVRNWINHIWLGGDVIEDYAIHNIDVACWIFDDYPIEAIGYGGREVLDNPAVGGIFDHFAVQYLLADGRHFWTTIRDIPKCDIRTEERVTFSRGVGTTGRWRANFTGFDGKVTLDRDFRRGDQAVNPLIAEHARLINAIRSGEPINTARTIAMSTLTAIMGRMATYTGQRVTQQFALEESTLDLLAGRPLAFGPQPPEEVPVPGQTPLV